MKKIISLMLFFILSLTSLPLASAQSIANCNLHCFSAGTPVQTKAGFKPIEEIRIGDFVLTKDERTGKTGYNTVVELFKRQAYETYRITVKGITITTTEEHPFWVPGQGWVEARHLKVGDLLQNPEGNLYPIDRIEIKNGITTVYNFRVQGVHTYFVTELEIWTHNCGAGGIRNIPMRAPTGGGGGFNQASNVGRAKNNLKPDNSATGAHTTFKRDSNGNVTNYSTYKPQTNTNTPNKWEQVKRYDGVGKGDGHFNKVTGQKIKEPHVHDPKTPGGVREPRKSGKETPMKW
ncbi:polymorphic toxin-type HINT domain-containing protein [Paenibacillus dendritiformis]|uniref:polymorphic toxin-type HINT domain-containing protein n=1 Tax=Paenibacillus dendritiformis TaxID=130049 RepID=UPI0036540A1E